MAYLMHHGIKGQKWGVRRYQNEDGSLTEAGKARYGGQKEYHSNGVRNLLTGHGRGIVTGFGYGRNLGEARADALEVRSRKRSEKASELEARGKTSRAEKLKEKSERLERKAAAQRAANDDRKAYDKHTSTGKMLAQNLLMTSWGAEKYRNARARGESRGRSIVESLFGYGITGSIITNKRSKKVYGEGTWSAM